MRVDVKKFLFVGMEKDKERFFQRAQKLGVLEFIDSQPSSGYAEKSEEIMQLEASIKILRSLPPIEQEEIDDFSLASSTASCIVKLNYKQEALYEEQRLLEQEISRVEVFGDFSLQDLTFIEKEGKRRIQFFFKKEESEVEAVQSPELLFVGAAHGLHYYMAVNKEACAYKGLIEMKVERPLGELTRRLKLVREELLAVEKELKQLSARNEFLHQALIDHLNQHHLSTAQDFAAHMMNESVFAVEGWVAECDFSRARELLDEVNVYCEEILIEESDRVPTHLKNEGLSRIGEDLVQIYDTPSMEDKDPSPWVLGGFALFFAMILGDGGYGLIFLAVSLFLWGKFPSLEGAPRRALKLFTILSVSCITWGVLSHSFFGISFAPDSAFRKYSVVQWLVEKKADYHFYQQDATYQEWVEKYPQLLEKTTSLDFLNGAVSGKEGELSYDMLEKFSGNVMLELALLVGIVHITLSFLRGLASNWSGVGWIIGMLGAYLNFPSRLQATSMLHFIGGVPEQAGAEVGLELMYAGIVVAVVLALVQHKLGGLLEIANLIQVFADVLSYLRLYALGLAGSMMSSTFNDIAASMSVTIGIVVLLVGHLINIVLSLIGGVIHGLRLHFIEWYHYSFEGGGRMHEPLKLLKIK